MRGSGAPYRAPPGLRGLSWESARVDVERVGGDGVDDPAVGECGAQLVLANAARAEVAGLPVAEAHEVNAAAGPEHRGQARHVTWPVFVAEHVEDAAIDERVKGCAEPAEVQRVADVEFGAGLALGRLRPGPLDRGSGNVDPGRVSAPARGQQRLLTSAAADVEYAAGQFAPVSKPDERGLRAAYVPRGRAGPV
jgi:hypothetical protein